MPRSIDFDQIFTILPSQYELKLKNPTRRKIKTNIFVDKEFSDIFVIEGISPNMVLGAKSLARAFVKFIPKIAVTYNAQIFVETDLGSATISLHGTGVEARLFADCESNDFGLVGQGLQEFREITVRNPTTLGMSLRFKSDNGQFTFEPCECFVAAGLERVVNINFLPLTKYKEEICNVEIILLELDGDEDKEFDMTEYSLRNEIAVLKKIIFKGTGGTFGIMADGKPVSAQAGKVDVIDMSFPKVNLRSKVQKSFQVENNGDVPFTFQITDKNGNILGDIPTLSPNGMLSCTVKVGSFHVSPKSKETIFITIEGINLGQDQFEFFVKTLGHSEPIKVAVAVETESVDAVGESLKAFIRAEDSFESMLSYETQYERLFATDLQLWKLILPIVRIGYKRPSEEMGNIPMVTPNITRPEIGPYLVRPPALPKTLPPRSKKWYMNRVSMGLEQIIRTQDEDTEMELFIRRQEAAEFIMPVEKTLFLEKKRTI